jgi:hypothetical protein
VSDQSGADAVVEIVEALVQGEEVDAIRALLRTFRPRAHPVPVAVAMLLTIHRRYRFLDEFADAVRRLDHRLIDEGHPERDALMRVLRSPMVGDGISALGDAMLARRR